MDSLKELLDSLGKDDVLTIKVRPHRVVVRLEADDQRVIEGSVDVNENAGPDDRSAASDPMQALSQAMDQVTDDYFERGEQEEEDVAGEPNDIAEPTREEAPK